MRRFALLSFLLMLPVAAQAADLTVSVAGITPGQADLRILLMDNRAHESMQDHVRGARTVKADHDTVTATFLGVPPGTYEVVAYPSDADATALKEGYVTVSTGPANLALSLH